MPLFFTLATSSSLVVRTGASVTWMPSAISSAFSMTCGGYLQGRQGEKREGEGRRAVRRPRRAPAGPAARPALTGSPGRRGLPTPWKATPGAGAGRCPPPAAPPRSAAETPAGAASGARARRPRAAPQPTPAPPPCAPGARPPPSPPPWGPPPPCTTETTAPLCSFRPRGMTSQPARAAARCFPPGGFAAREAGRTRRGLCRQRPEGEP